MKFTKLFVAVAVLLGFGFPVHGSDLPLYPGNHTVWGNEQWAPNPVVSGFFGGGMLPIIGEASLNDPPFRWVAKKMASGSVEFLDRIGVNLDRWNLVTIGCSYYQKQGYCSVSFNSSDWKNGGQSYSFAVKGDPTRIGTRSFLGLGRRRKIGADWVQTYYFESHATRSAFVARILSAQP